MTLRLLTAGDASWVGPLMRPFYTSTLPDDQIVRVLTDTGNPSVTVGDPAVVTPSGQGVMAKVEHYQLPTSFAIPTLQGQFATQVVAWLPMAFGSSQATTFDMNTMLPLLAHLLHRIALAYPIVANRPLWAFTSKRIVDFASPSLVQMQSLSVGTNRYVWFDHESDADTALLAFRP